MGSRIRAFFFGKSDSNSDSLTLKTQSYDSTIALDPPVKGPWPVPGNGLNVLGAIQRSRARSSAQGQPTIVGVAAAPNVPRQRDHPAERPQTAPHNGKPGGGYTPGRGQKEADGRTRSGFSMKSPPSFFSSTRRHSAKSINRPTPVISDIPDIPQLPSFIFPPREVIALRPKKGPEPEDANIENFEEITPPFVKHERNASQASHRPFVDLLDAHSSINPSQVMLKHRVKASGVRDYGEDVADRNIPAGRSKPHNRDHQWDLNSPQFSYLKSVYVPKSSGLVNRGLHSRNGSAPGHVLGLEKPNPSDDKTDLRTYSMRSIHSPSAGASFSARVDSYSANRNQDDHSIGSNGVKGPRGKALSLSSTTSINEEGYVRDARRRTPISAIPPIPVRGQAQFLNNSSPKQIERRMSGASQKTVTRSSNGSISYSPFPSTSPPQTRSDKTLDSTPRPQPAHIQSTTGEGEGAVTTPILEEASGPVDTIDKDITEVVLPAVTHKHVTSARHQIRQEKITREIHTHDIVHRIQPVTETEILPAKHYIPSSDGKGLIEIDEHELPDRAQNANSNPKWQISGTGTPKDDHYSSRPRSQSQSSYQYPQSNPHNEQSDSPVISSVRDGSRASRSRENPPASNHTAKSPFTTKDALDSTLISKTTQGKKDHSKPEYGWRPLPAVETSTTHSQPMYAGVGLGDINSATTDQSQEDHYYSDEDDAAGARFGAARISGRRRERLFFKDSGYGSRGMLPGLLEKDPMSAVGKTAGLVDFEEKIRLGKVLDER